MKMERVMIQVTLVTETPSGSNAGARIYREWVHPGTVGKRVESTLKRERHLSYVPDKPTTNSKGGTTRWALNSVNGPARVGGSIFIGADSERRKALVLTKKLAKKFAEKLMTRLKWPEESGESARLGAPENDAPTDREYLEECLRPLRTLVGTTVMYEKPFIDA